MILLSTLLLVVADFVSKFLNKSRDLWPEYEYTAELYRGSGAIDAEKNPTFFVTMKYSNDLMDIFKTVTLYFKAVWLHLSP